MAFLKVLSFAFAIKWAIDAIYGDVCLTTLVNEAVVINANDSDISSPENFSRIYTNG